MVLKDKWLLTGTENMFRCSGSLIVSYIIELWCMNCFLKLPKEGNFYLLYITMEHEIVINYHLKSHVRW